MNIFAVSSCPIESAKQLPDRHNCKMIVETCQLLSIVYSSWYHDWGTIPKADGTPYSTEKGAFRNHPCTVWLSESYDNLAWLIVHGYALCHEYSFRYNKVHSSYDTIRAAAKIFEQKVGKLNRYKNVTSFVRAMPDELKYNTELSDTEAYQQYMNTKTWVSSNYLRVPSRKPNWILDNEQ